MFLLAMLNYFNLKRENIATPSGYIFVFIDEVLNKKLMQNFSR